MLLRRGEIINVNSFSVELFTTAFVTDLLSLDGNPIVMLAISMTGIYAAGRLETMDRDLNSFYPHLLPMLSHDRFRRAVFSLNRLDEVTYTSPVGTFNSLVQAPSSRYADEQQLSIHSIGDIHFDILSPSQFAYPACLITPLSNLRALISLLQSEDADL